MSNRKVILYIAMSIDGYIAKEDGNIDFLDVVDSTGEDYGYQDFIKSVDTVIMGRKSYDKILSFDVEWPHKNEKCYVLSRSANEGNENIEYYNGNIITLIQTLRETDGKNIFCDGGSEIVLEFMKADLIDEYVISVIPVLLGNGIKLFKEGTPAKTLKLYSVKRYNSGLVQLTYVR